MASRGINKVILVGNLGQDPEVRYTANQSAVANVRIATSESWKDKATGEQKEQTEWHSVVFFGRLAEIVSEYLKKGSQIYVEGRLRTRKWQDKEGQDRYTTEIVADEMQMLGGRGGGSGGGMERGGDTPARSAPSRSPAPAGGSKPAAAVEDFDDDIPF